MGSVIIVIAAILLLFISCVHVYWASGGSWGSVAAVPEKSDGEALFKPKAVGTVVVALLLLVACAALLTEGEVVDLLGRIGVSEAICIACAAVFFLRAVGDFNYIGFFKKIRLTAFGRNDTKFYSPMCLFLGIAFLLALLR